MFRFVSTLCLRTTCIHPSFLPSSLRPLSLSLIHHDFSNMKKMMDELSRNPKAMAMLEAMKKNPKIMHSVQDLMMTMSRKGYIDLTNPRKQPSLAMLADTEVRNKLFDLIKLLADAGIFNMKNSSNPMDALSNVMGLLMPPRTDEPKQPSNSKPKYDFTYDATAKENKVQPNDFSSQGWTDKLRKMFK